MTPEPPARPCADAKRLLGSGAQGTWNLRGLKDTHEDRRLLSSPRLLFASHLFSEVPKTV